MRQLLAFVVILFFSIFIFSCGKKNNCATEHTGSIMIHNDGSFMPTGTANFYNGSTLLASVAKGSTITVDNVPIGKLIMTVKIGADTIYNDAFQPDTIVQCKTIHYYTSVHYIPVSDKRLKKNILPINALNDIGKLNIYSFEYQTAKNYLGFLPKGIHYGFMAQELKDVYPSFVQLNSNGYYSVNYQEMIPILAKGIQEQQSQIDDLKKEVSDLKSVLKQQQTFASK